MNTGRLAEVRTRRVEVSDACVRNLCWVEYLRGQESGVPPSVANGNFINKTSYSRCCFAV